MHTGSFTFARPSIGSWVSYGLGTENRNLPSFVVIAPQTPYAGGQVWASDFLPGAHQGTLVVPGAEPIANIQRRAPPARLAGTANSALLRALNQRHLAHRAGDPLLAARIQSFETAFGMQTEVPGRLRPLQGNRRHARALRPAARQTKGFGWQCLVARRLVERGVRFVELIDTGSSNNWDSHGDMIDHAPLAKNVDQPIAGLLRDLKQRGMLDDTLVVWTTEFGRTPFNDSRRRQGPRASPLGLLLLAGRRGREGRASSTARPTNTASTSANDPVHVHDFHATILHLLGLDHERLTYRHTGRDYRLTDVAGNVVNEILA